MTLFQIRGTKVTIHPLLLLVVAGAGVAGVLSELLQAFLALTLHESFHAVVASRLGYRIESVELLPFGGVARIEHTALAPGADFLIALAGPLCNVVVAGAVALAMHLFPVIELKYFLFSNLVLALFNLLPASPLDGGRMLRAILSRVMRQRLAGLCATWLGVALGALLLGTGLYLLLHGAFNPFLWVMGVFLLLSALREFRALPQAQVHAAMRRKDALARGEAVPLRQVVVHEDMPTYVALSQLCASQYNMLLVLDAHMEVIGQLDEGRLIKGIAKHGRQVPVGRLLSRQKSAH